MVQTFFKRNIESSDFNFLTLNKKYKYLYMI